VTDHLKLTTYFAERQRHNGRFFSDELLDLYADSAVATSVVLRGISSFGPHHELRSDQSLSLSEDPPIAVAAVDTTDKIAGLADRVSAMTTRGLLTLERVRFADPFSQPTDITKFTIYIGRQDRVDGRPAYRTVCDVLHRIGFAGASVFLGVDGTAHGQRRRAGFFSRNIGVPVMIIAVGAGEQVAEAVLELQTLLREPIFTIERVQVCKRDGTVLTPPAALPATDDNGRPLWQKLMVYTSEAGLHNGVPIHRAIVRELFDSRAAAGATVLRGLWGYHDDHEPHGDKLLQLARRVPVTTIVVDAPDSIAASFDIIDRLTDEQGLVTSELVPALVSVDNGQRRGSTALAQYRY